MRQWLKIIGNLSKTIRIRNILETNFFFHLFSAMPPSLGSMTSQCLQQRDGYPYMFTDPLHSLSPYSSHPSRSACNPTAAHQQSHYSTSGSPATGKSSLTSYFWRLHERNQFNEGVITAGISVPIQIPSQGPDIGTNYWPRLQWSSFFGLPTLGEFNLVQMLLFSKSLNTFFVLPSCWWMQNVF